MPVPSLTGDDHTAMQHLCDSTATPAAGLQGTPKLSLHAAQSTGSHSSSATRSNRHSKDRSSRQDPAANQAAPVPETAQPPATPARVLLCWLLHPACCPRKEPRAVWKFIKASCKTKGCPACPLCHNRQLCKARNVPLPGKCLLKGMLVLSVKFRAH